MLTATAFKAIRAAIPSATDSDCNYIIWGRTSFPFDGLTSEILYKAAYRLVRAQAKGIVLCEFCDNIAPKAFLCVRCKTSLEKARHHE